MYVQKKHYLTFDHEFGVKVTRYVGQYPQHHVTYSATKFEVAMTNDLGDTLTRNVSKGLTQRCREGPQTDFGKKLILPFFQRKKRVK